MRLKPKNTLIPSKYFYLFQEDHINSIFNLILEHGLSRNFGAKRFSEYLRNITNKSRAPENLFIQSHNYSTKNLISIVENIYFVQFSLNLPEQEPVKFYVRMKKLNSNGFKNYKDNYNIQQYLILVLWFRQIKYYNENNENIFKDRNRNKTIDQIMKALRNCQLLTGTIKPTSNNIVSSRSNIALPLSITSNSKAESTYCIWDLAGTENIIKFIKTIIGNLKETIEIHRINIFIQLDLVM